MTQFGFGEKTGIDINEEIPALMPSRGWKELVIISPGMPVKHSLSVSAKVYWTATPMN